MSKSDFIKNFNWKYLVFVVIFYFATQNIGAFFGKSKAEKEIDTQRKSLISEVENYSQKLPKKIDSVTTQISIIYDQPTKTLTYKNTITDTAVSQISQSATDELKSALSDDFKKYSCNSLLSKYPLVLQNVETIYFTNSNVSIFKILTTASECRNS